MIHLGHILIIDEDGTRGEAMLARVRALGYEGLVAGTAAAAIEAVARTRPDIVLVGPTPDREQIALGAAIKAAPGGHEIPVCLMAPDRRPALRRDALAAGIDDMLAPPLSELKLSARLRPLLRLSVMHQELHLRAGTARRFGLSIDETVERDRVEAGYPLLVVGPEGEAVSRPLAEAKIALAADPFAAEEMLDRSNFDAAVLAPETSPHAYLDLCAQARNNPRLFNLPVLMLGGDEGPSEEDSYRNGASGYFARPADDLELRSAVLSLVRRQRLRWAIRQALMKTLAGDTRDEGTGVYRRAFLDSYLAERVEFARSHGRHLSVIFVRIPDVENIRQRFGEPQAAHLRLQLAQWITGLLRGEDLTARYDDNEFCVVLPDTPAAEAAIVTHRIGGVLANTDFAVKDVYQPVKVWVFVGCADLRTDDDVATLIQRGRQAVV